MVSLVSLTKGLVQNFPEFSLNEGSAAARFIPSTFMSRVSRAIQKSTALVFADNFPDCIGVTLSTIPEEFRARFKFMRQLCKDPLGVFQTWSEDSQLPAIFDRIHKNAQALVQPFRAAAKLLVDHILIDYNSLQARALNDFECFSRYVWARQGIAATADAQVQEPVPHVTGHPDVDENSRKAMEQTLTVLLLELFDRHGLNVPPQALFQYFPKAFQAAWKKMGLQPCLPLPPGRMTAFFRQVVRIIKEDLVPLADCAAAQDNSVCAASATLSSLLSEVEPQPLQSVSRASSVASSSSSAPPPPPPPENHDFEDLRALVNENRAMLKVIMKHLGANTAKTDIHQAVEADALIGPVKSLPPIGFVTRSAHIVAKEWIPYR